jgi:hypothetical protein
MDSFEFKGTRATKEAEPCMYLPDAHKGLTIPQACMLFCPHLCIIFATLMYLPAKYKAVPTATLGT